MEPVHLYNLGVNLENKQFYLKKLYVFIGDVPESIAEELKAKKPSKLLEKYYGENYMNLLGLTPQHITNGIWNNIEGGNDSDVFDINELSEEPAAKPKHAVKAISNRSQLETTPELEFIFNVHLYPEDRLSEFKEKINLAINIPIYRQHLFSVLNSEKHLQMIPIRYKLITDSSILINIMQIFNNNVAKILNIPIDSNLFQSREYLMVEAYDFFITLHSFYISYGLRTFYLVDIDDFIAPQKELLVDLIRKDTYQLQLLYWGFIVKYWPVMSYDVFKIYLMNIKELVANYPDLTNLYTQKYEKERVILDEKYKLLNDARGHSFIDNEFKKPYYLFPEFKKYNPEFSIISEEQIEKGIVQVSIRSAILESIMINDIFRGNLTSQIKINVRNLFGKISTSALIPIIRVKLLMEGNLITLTKLRTPPMVENQPDDIQKVYEKVKYRIQMPYYNTVLFVVKIPQKLMENTNYLIFSVYDYGKYNIRSSWEENMQINFKQVFHIIEETINPVIDLINSLGRSVFESVKQLSPIKKSNTEFSSLNMNILWKMPMTRSVFDKIAPIIQENIEAHIIKPSENASIPGTYEFAVIKGMVEYGPKMLEKHINILNYYEYLSNAKIKQNWIKLFEQGRIVTMNHRTADIRLEVLNLKEKEFTNFYQYIITFLYQIERRLLTKDNVLEKPKKVNMLSNVNKLLKSVDPELYVFKRFGSDVVFSRICQKEHQPIPYLPEEYENLDAKIKDKSIKYWNFTTKSPIYYYCPNDNFPYLNFLINQHPKGYCIPCCKKTPPFDALESSKNQKEQEDDHKIAKKELIYNICMQSHEYNETDIQSGPSRYIMNYGKSIDIGRIGKLPDLLDRYLLYNLEDATILNQEDQVITADFGFGKRSYSVKALWKIARDSPIIEEPLDKYVKFLKSQTWSGREEKYNAIDIINNPSLGPEHYNRISNVNLAYPILIYKFNGRVVVLDGIHRIAKLYIDHVKKNIPLNKINIKVQEISTKQLFKSEIKSPNQPAARLTKRLVKNKKNIKKSNTSDEDEDEDEDIGPTKFKHYNEEYEPFIVEKKIIGNAEDIKDSHFRQPGYYLYGVPQNNINVSNIGAGFAIASALSLSFPEFIQNTIMILRKKSNMNYFRVLLHGRLSQYFPDIDALLSIMINLFLDENLTIDANINRFYFWNELFIDIAKVCFQKYVIVIDDTTIDTIGTSIKNAKIMENINILLPEKITYVDEIIPECNNSINCELNENLYTKEYILLLRKRKKTKTMFSTNKIYYPIFIFIPQMFFKSMSIEKRIYMYKDEIIKLIRNLLVASIEDAVQSNIKKNLDSISLEVILQFIDDCHSNKISIGIQTIYTNSKNMFYALTLNMSNILYYIPINFIYYNLPPSDYFINLDKAVSYQIFQRSNNLCTFSQLKDFIELYNTFVINYSEKQGLYRIVQIESSYGNKLNERENRIMPVFPLIKVQNFLFLIENRHFIGIQNTYNNISTYMYVKDLPVNKDNLKELYKIFTKGYWVLTQDISLDAISNIIHYIRYDPDKINKMIQNVSSNSQILTQRIPDISKLYQAIYQKHLYRLFLLELMTLFDQERNDSLRKQIIEIINTPSRNLGQNLEQLSTLLQDYPDDLAIIKNLIQSYLTMHFNKKILIQDIQRMIYKFDHTSLLEIENMSQNYYKNDDKTRAEQRTQIKKYIDKKIRPVIYEGEPDFKKEGISNIFAPCATEINTMSLPQDDTQQGYCHNKKLIISPKKLDNLIDIFISDIVNPIKRPYLLSSILLTDIQNFFQFEKRKDEEIYLRYF